MASTTIDRLDEETIGAFVRGLEDVQAEFDAILADLEGSTAAFMQITDGEAPKIHTMLQTAVANLCGATALLRTQRTLIDGTIAAHEDTREATQAEAAWGVAAS